jgi:hypothetical protein
MGKRNWFPRIFSKFKPYVIYVELKDGTLLRWRGYGFEAPEYKLIRGSNDLVVRLESKSGC